jgi:hypothetical protein
VCDFKRRESDDDGEPRGAVGEAVAKFAANRDNVVVIPELALNVGKDLASYGVVIDDGFVAAAVGAALDLWSSGMDALRLAIQIGK